MNTITLADILWWLLTIGYPVLVGVVYRLLAARLQSIRDDAREGASLAIAKSEEALRRVQETREEQLKMRSDITDNLTLAVRTATQNIFNEISKVNTHMGGIETCVANLTGRFEEYIRTNGQGHKSARSSR